MQLQADVSSSNKSVNGRSTKEAGHKAIFCCSPFKTLDHLVCRGKFYQNWRKENFFYTSHSRGRGNGKLIFYDSRSAAGISSCTPGPVDLAVPEHKNGFRFPSTGTSAKKYNSEFIFPRDHLINLSVTFHLRPGNINGPAIRREAPHELPYIVFRLVRTTIKHKLLLLRWHGRSSEVPIGEICTSFCPSAAPGRTLAPDGFLPLIPSRRSRSPQTRYRNSLSSEIEFSIFNRIPLRCVASYNNSERTPIWRARNSTPVL